MDPHYLSRKDRHTIGTTPENSSSSSDDSSDSESSSSSSDSESSVEIRKVIKKPKGVKKDWKVQRKLDKLRVKNKQLQDLFLNKSKKNKHNKYSDNLSEDSDASGYLKTPVVNTSQPLYFC